MNEYINAINDAYAEIEEKKRLMIDSDKELDGVKANVSEKKIELTTLEVKIEMLNRRQKKLGIYIDEENEAYKILEEAIDL